MEQGLRIVQRECGGWIASGRASGTLRIGVTADSESAALERFREAVSEWERNLSLDRGSVIEGGNEADVESSAR
jgi:hypothetical protein